MRDLLSETRKRIISLLRGGDRTVNELAAELGLTDNAIRSHLDSLQRQGLVASSGTRPGTRKPHAAYTLTAEAKRVFFEGCEPLLSQLISVLSQRLPKDQFEATLRECGQRMAEACSSVPRRGSIQERIDFALGALKSLGGAAVLDHQGGQITIRGEACPWGAIVAQHPEVCAVAEALLTELIGAPVKEHCTRGPAPHCQLQIRAPRA